MGHAVSRLFVAPIPILGIAVIDMRQQNGLAKLHT